MSEWKALSLRHPWLWWVLRGTPRLRKTLENREQWYGHRGPFILHASLAFTRAYYDEAWGDVHKAFGFDASADMPHAIDFHGSRALALPTRRFPFGGFCGVGRVVAAIRGGAERPDVDELGDRFGMVVRSSHVAVTLGEREWDLRWRLKSKRHPDRLQNAYLLDEVRELPFVPGPGALGFFRAPPDVVARLGLPKTPEEYEALRGVKISACALDRAASPEARQALLGIAAAAAEKLREGEP